jgi:hypothetical protein
MPTPTRNFVGAKTSQCAIFLIVANFIRSPNYANARPTRSQPRDARGWCHHFMTNKSRNQVEKEMRVLRRQVEKHNYQYHVLDDPLISDAEYDELFRRLVELEKQYPEWVSADSPTRKVGAAPLDKFTTVQHTLPMLSLSNAVHR